MTHILRIPAVLLALPLWLAACGPAGTTDAAGQDQAGHGHAAATDEAEKGPHGGRMLRDGDFALELAIFESGVPPEYRAWATQGGEALPPEEVELSVTLTRLDGERNVFGFAPQGDFLRGDGVVTEPHSFDVEVEVRHAGTAHRWAYASYEGRVTIPQDSAREAGIRVESAGPQVIHDVLPVYGRIVADPEAVHRVGARYPGVIRSVAASVGDTVQAGEVLARVEANDSLRVYAVTAPIDGTVTARSANPGDPAGEATLFTVVDLSQPWAELTVFARDWPRVQVGQKLHLRSLDGELAAEGEIVRIAPTGEASGQARKVWARLDGAQALTPGLFVHAQIRVGGERVPLAVRTSALQGFRDFTVVFARVGETYEVRMLELGRRDDEHVEVLGGLKPGTEYVTGNSYLIKADIEKSGASHDH